MVGLFAVVTWGAVGAKLCAEFADLASAFDSLDQSYSIRGVEIVHQAPTSLRAPGPPSRAPEPALLAAFQGSTFIDNAGIGESAVEFFLGSGVDSGSDGAAGDSDSDSGGDSDGDSDSEEDSDSDTDDDSDSDGD